MKRALFSTISLPVIIAMVFAFTLATFGGGGSAEAALSTAGKLTQVKGTVGVFRKGKTKGIRAKVGTLIFPGDKIKTYADSTALLVLRDNSKIVIAPKSTMKMGKFMLNKKAEKRSAFLSILGGKIRVIAQKMYKMTANGKRKLWGNSDFKIKTPTAVVGVKGTDFVVTVTLDDGRIYTGIIVVEGTVETHGVNPLGGLTKSQIIGQMQEVTVTEEGSVSEPKPVSQESMAVVASTVQYLENVDSILSNEGMETGLVDDYVEDLTIEEVTCASPPC